MIENSRDEEVCRRWDVLADEDHTYHLPEQEYFCYKNKWWLHLNKQGSDTVPLRKRSDFKQALSASERLHQEDGGHRVRPLHGNGKTPSGLLNIQKVKEEASKVMGKNGETRCLQYFRPLPPRPGMFPRCLLLNQCIGVDLVDLEVRDGTSAKALNVVCCGTGLQIVQPLWTNHTAKTVMKEFKIAWVKHYGWPEIIVHDQGPEFMGNEVQNPAGAAGILTMPIDS